MEIKNYELDIIFNNITKTSSYDEKMFEDMKKILSNGGIEFSRLSSIWSSIASLTLGNKKLKILDYGSGGGRLIVYLRLLGYENCFGIDLYSNYELKKMNFITSKITLDNKPIFYSYDGNSLPFDNSSFDLIISQQVVEHVHNLERYYSESSRILNNNGKLLLDFPHRLIPFDTHTKMWFVHYLPRNIRNFFYNKYRSYEGRIASDYYDEILNLKSKTFHKKILKKYFSKVDDQTASRILNFDKKNYEGNIRIRHIFHLIINIPKIGFIFAKCLSIFANAEIVVKK